MNAQDLFKEFRSHGFFDDLLSDFMDDGFFGMQRGFGGGFFDDDFSGFSGGFSQSVSSQTIIRNGEKIKVTTKSTRNADGTTHTETIEERTDRNGTKVIN